MSKIRVLADQLINQIAAGEVVERPASVAKELVENAIDAGARRISVDTEAGGQRLLRVADDGCGMTTDDAVLAFERHATSKIATSADLSSIATLGFRGEALASIASVARIELVTKTEDAAAATRVVIEGGRMRDVKDAAHPRGTTLTVRDLFFNVPARRKFLRSEATESFHLTNLVTHYALAHPEIAFTLTNNGRETLRAPAARDVRERAYQIFGSSFVENLLEVRGGLTGVALISGFISAPRERRTSRDAQYLFINGRYVRDPLLARALSEGYRTVLPQGVYPAALLFLDVPLEEVDVNVHPAKAEVRFRRAAAVADSVREAVRTALASAGFVRASEPQESLAVEQDAAPDATEVETRKDAKRDFDSPVVTREAASAPPRTAHPGRAIEPTGRASDAAPLAAQSRIEFGDAARDEARIFAHETDAEQVVDESARVQPVGPSSAHDDVMQTASRIENGSGEKSTVENELPPVASVAGLVREVPLEAIATNIRPIGQLEASFIVATDDEGLLLIDQTHAHERILFDQYRARERGRAVESQNLLMPETFDLTPAQAAAFGVVEEDLEAYGFGLMRLSGRTVAIRAVPAELPAGEARNLLAELLETVDAEKKGGARSSLHDRVAAALASRAAIKSGTTLALEKMSWIVDRLLLSSSPTTCPHGRPIILRLATRDIEKNFHRS